jgi:AAA+ ATPase superfamily predicted ATPase
MRSQSLQLEIAEVLAEHAPLRHEPEFLLREELREVESYFAVLLAIAGGRAMPRDISGVTAIGERSLHYYLQQLVELGYVRRRYPLSESSPAARHVRFTLDDALLRFWFRFVFPNTSYLAQMGPERTLRDRIRPALDAYLGACFEGLCREALPHLYARERVAASFEVGEYWDKRCQIDDEVVPSHLGIPGARPFARRRVAREDAAADRCVALVRIEAHRGLQFAPRQTGGTHDAPPALAEIRPAVLT